MSATASHLIALIDPTKQRRCSACCSNQAQSDARTATGNPATTTSGGRLAVEQVAHPPSDQGHQGTDQQHKGTAADQHHRTAVDSDRGPGGGLVVVNQGSEDIDRFIGVDDDYDEEVVLVS